MLYSQTCLERTKNLFCEWCVFFLLIRGERELYQQKQILSGFVMVCVYILLLNVRDLFTHLSQLHVHRPHRITELSSGGK